MYIENKMPPYVQWYFEIPMTVSSVGPTCRNPRIRCLLRILDFVVGCRGALSFRLRLGSAKWGLLPCNVQRSSAPQLLPEPSLLTTFGTKASTGIAACMKHQLNPMLTRGRNCRGTGAPRIQRDWMRPKCQTPHSRLQVHQAWRDRRGPGPASRVCPSDCHLHPSWPRPLSAVPGLHMGRTPTRSRASAHFPPHVYDR